MQRIRVTVSHNSNDPADDLRCAARVRRDIWAHSPAEIEVDSPGHGTRRDSDENAYFEFATDHCADVERVIRERGYANRVRVAVVQKQIGDECTKCGDISLSPVAVCAKCGFRDIAPCPYCQSDVARLSYLVVGGDLFRCPKCKHRVRMRLQDEQFDGRGALCDPLILVEKVEADRVEHG